MQKKHPQHDEDLEEDDDEADDAQDETMMAAERMDTYYLPPSAPQLGLPHTIVTYDGKAVDAAIAANPDVADKIRAGKVQAAGALIGAVMKQMRGQADAAKVRELIISKLS